MQNFSDRVQG